MRRVRGGGYNWRKKRLRLAFNCFPNKRRNLTAVNARRNQPRACNDQRTNWFLNHGHLLALQVLHRTGTLKCQDSNLQTFKNIFYNSSNQFWRKKYVKICLYLSIPCSKGTDIYLVRTIFLTPKTSSGKLKQGNRLGINVWELFSNWNNLYFFTVFFFRLILKIIYSVHFVTENVGQPKQKC